MMLSPYLTTPIHKQKPLSVAELLDRLTRIPEPHVQTWRSYQAEAANGSVWEVLRRKLVQLQFPIRQGISRTPDYCAATRQGADVYKGCEAGGLFMEKATELQLKIHAGVAGDVPVLIAATRADFCTLVQALTKRNEPVSIPDSMGACLVAGYNNWDRIRACRRQWLAGDPARTDTGWPQRFRELLPHKRLYQDRFIILSRGPYSHIEAAELGLDADEWLSLSLKIRLEHECAHLLTKRLFGIIRQHLHDELLADYAGIVAALGYFRADWFLHFMGLENHPGYRPGGRLENYLERSWQQEATLSQITEILAAAAHNLERFDRDWAGQERDWQSQAAILCAIAGTSLIEIAAHEGDQLLRNNFVAWRTAVAALRNNGLHPQAGGDLSLEAARIHGEAK
jgi:hypothetical protein